MKEVINRGHLTPTLIKIDRNGSKHYEGDIKCDRCGGSGIYAWCVRNGVVVPTIVDNGVCHKCNGTGVVHSKWIERTAEYQAKLDAKRNAKHEAERAKIEAERAEIEAQERAEREKREAQIRAEKAISQHIGNVGDKIEVKGSFVKTASWMQNSFRGYGTDRIYLHIFKDSYGNVFVWRTQKDIGMNYGEIVIVKGTVKKHSEYMDEKQTELTRCKLSFPTY